MLWIAAIIVAILAYMYAADHFLTRHPTSWAYQMCKSEQWADNCEPLRHWHGNLSEEEIRQIIQQSAEQP